MPVQPRVLDVCDVANVPSRVYKEVSHTSLVRRELVKRGREWLLVSLPIYMIDYETGDESNAWRRRGAQAHLRRGVILPTIASYGDLSRNGKAHVHDDKHFILAAELRGDLSASVFMPRSEYELLISDAKRLGRIGEL